MRTMLICFVVILGAFVSYAYAQNPDGCKKVVYDVQALLVSLWSGATQPKAAPQNQPAHATASIPAKPAVSVPTAPAPNSTQADAEIAALPTKPWTPPDVMPAQPNWTWETSDGKTYQNVVVTEIEPDTVTITHSMGVAHIPIAFLTPDIQKQLHYDPVTAAAARAENARELAHPYYNFASLAEAQSVARRLHRPLAWMCGHLSTLKTANPATGSEEDLTQMALNDLKSQAVVIFLDGNTDLPALSPIIRDEQFFKYDDGPVPGGHHFYAPKIVFSDADITKAYGRVSYTQMKATRELAIDELLASIAKDSDGSASSAAPPVPATTWAPPDVMPAQPNWTWTTSDGKTYQNVVVTKIEPLTVTITHSTGVAHIPIFLLPPDIQKQLNYDPHAAGQ